MGGNNTGRVPPKRVGLESCSLKPLGSLVAVRGQPPSQAADRPPDRTVSITYTGGTTGKPKGVIGGFGNVHDDADSTLRSENGRV